MSTALSRRRFIAISATAAGLALLPRGVGAGTSDLHVWRGAALGADATIRLHHPDAAEADRLVRLALAEVERLERVFSLYRAGSALVRLNRDGFLNAPPGDLLRLLSEAATFAASTDGAFDVTVQPLWQLYAGHFARTGADPDGPPESAVAAARRLVDHRAVRLEPDRVAFAQRGMAVTLNGIAQGYITDRVAELLRAEGLTRVLVDLGEIRAVGPTWRVGLEDPHQPGRIARTLEVDDRAVATSGGYGIRFDGAGRFTHLFDPATGRCAPYWSAVTVLAADATTADALSTALSVVPPERAASLVHRHPGVTAYLTAADGAVTAFDT